MRGTALLLKRALILVLLGASIWILGAWTRDHASVLSMTRRALQTDEDPSNPVPALLNFESERAHRQPLETQHQATGRPLEEGAARAIPPLVGNVADSVLTDNNNGLPEDLEFVDEGANETDTEGQGFNKSPLLLPADPSARTIDDAGAALSSQNDGEDTEESAGLALIHQVGLTVPPLAFDFNDSAPAKALRFREKVAEFRALGMADAPARLKAQLYERELVNRRARAKHAQKRALVRLIQEARLRKDTMDRDQRLAMIKIKQEEAAKEIEEDRRARAEAEELKESRRRQMASDTEGIKKKLVEQREMMNQMRVEEKERADQENQERRDTEKQEKKADAQAREQRMLREKEEKRRMLEGFQAAMAGQIEDNRKLAREERMKETGLLHA